MMMIPYVNAMIRTLTQQQFRKMLLILFVLLSIVPTFGLRDYFKTMDGYSPAWLIFCYLIGAYMKLYCGEPKSKKATNSLMIILMNVAVVTVFWLITDKTFLEKHIQLYEYTSPFMVINAACFVFVFSQISISNEKVHKILLRLSNSAFGVYIIHSHILIYDFWLKDAFSKAGTAGTFGFCLMLLASLLSIYLLCWVIDEIRMLIFKVLHIKKLTGWIGEKIDHFLNWHSFASNHLTSKN